MSEIEKELQRTRTSRDAAIEASSTRTAELDRLKIEKALVERKAAEKLKTVGEDFTRALQKVRTEASTWKLEAGKVPALLKDVALKEMHATKWRDNFKTIEAGLKAEKIRNLEQVNRLKAKLVALGHPEP